jgi:hypothetical protein
MVVRGVVGSLVVSSEDEAAEKLHDFQRDPAYERRIVAFYDFLGWRSKINEAGDDPEKIGNLRRMILRHSLSLRGQQQYAAPDTKVSTFSDNMVVSLPVIEVNVVHLLTTLGAFQIASVGGGFLVRGGVTVGKIHHDELSVFGPALNRAYEIESQIAVVPRIVVDENVFENGFHIPFFMRQEQGIRFIDPFSTKFVDIVSSPDREDAKDIYSSLGLPVSKKNLSTVSAQRMLTFALNAIKPQLRVPLGEKEWEKMAWVYDRIAEQLGVPPAKSYPRVRLGDVGVEG